MVEVGLYKRQGRRGSEWFSRSPSNPPSDELKPKASSVETRTHWEVSQELMRPPALFICSINWNQFDLFHYWVTECHSFTESPPAYLKMQPLSTDRTTLGWHYLMTPHLQQHQKHGSTYYIHTYKGTWKFSQKTRCCLNFDLNVLFRIITLKGEFNQVTKKMILCGGKWEFSLANMD